tara:strand:- start:4195 stop:4980 length:786 start_codon:yes stop_codon:yes gene_type:complete
MNQKSIIKEIKESVCYLTINRPKNLNALNKNTITELSSEIIVANQDISIRCIVLTGSENKAFVAGADIKEFISFSKSEGEKLARKGQNELFDIVENSSKPIIAAINGFALGGGLELAMACHIRIASENAKMGLPEVSLGVIPGYGGTQRLAQLVGKGKAMEMITTAIMISANEAKNWGLVNHVCSQEELIEISTKMAKSISKNSPMAVSKAIKCINSGYTFGAEGYEVEKKEFGNCFGTPDFIEGTTAFIEKRKPNFSNIE